MSSAPAKVRPSGFLYLVPLVLVIVGGIAAIVSIVNGVDAYSTTIEDFARVEVGETSTIEIDGTGGYTVFYEPGVSDESELTENDPEPVVTMTDPSGQTVVMADYGSLGTYGSSGHVGIAIRTFDVDEPGRYRVETNAGQVLGGTIAVGRSPFSKITSGVLLGLLFGFGGFVIALVVTILLMVSRGRSKRRIRAANPYVPYVAPAWSGGPPGAPQYPTQYPPGPYPPAQPPAAPPPGPGPGGFGPPPAAPPPAAPPPVPPGDDTTPGWGQPQQ